MIAIPTDVILNIGIKTIFTFESVGLYFQSLPFRPYEILSQIHHSSPYEPNQLHLFDFRIWNWQLICITLEVELEPKLRPQSIRSFDK